MKKIAIVGGGAAGMTCAVLLARKGFSVTILERGARLGQKLSATGNGQGNVTNIHMGVEHYFTDDSPKVARALKDFGADDAIRFLESMGGIFLPDTRGRVYPASRQASGITDLFRREIERLHIEVRFGFLVKEIKKQSDFVLQSDKESFHADAVVLCAGGKAAPNFGTDGSGYEIAKKLSHTLTKLTPALVQLKSEPRIVRSLKGIRRECFVQVLRSGEEIASSRGDVLFTESGVSGDAIFRLSSYARAGDELQIDLIPEVSVDALREVNKRSGLLCVLNNGLARELTKRAGGDAEELLRLIKQFTLPVTGSLGFAYAQVTKGGIPLSETDDFFMSKLVKDLYFAGEILNVDGECGGYNLQWAFTSAARVAEGILC